MSKRIFFSLLALLAVSLSSGGCGHGWRVGVYQDPSYDETTVATPYDGFGDWYPGMHLHHGIHHLAGLFTCYGCGGNYWSCKDGCNGGQGSFGTPLPHSTPYNGNVEPIPTPTEAPKPVPEKTDSTKTIRQTSYRANQNTSQPACNCQQ
jgi:hypothetical protein